tara:strand:+ start:617 stop:1543 length:927 start_codon:yes stop_codon:yes gene_type:complete
MKKILIILFIGSPIFLMGQSKGEFSVKLNEGMVYDSKHTKNDIFTYNPDMSTRHDGTGKAQNGIQFSTGYALLDNLVVGLSIMHSKIEGSNDVEYWSGKFTETNLFAEYEFIKKYGLGLFAKAGFGGIFYDASRYLESDGGSVDLINQLGEDKSDGAASKFLYGAGLSYQLYDAIKLSFEMTRNVVYDDGFDGWNQDEHRDTKGTDRFVYVSVGVSYAFKNKNQSSTELIEQIPTTINSEDNSNIQDNTDAPQEPESNEQIVPDIEGAEDTIEEVLPDVEGGDVIEEKAPALDIDSEEIIQPEQIEEE